MKKGFFKKHASVILAGLCFFGFFPFLAFALTDGGAFCPPVTASNTEAVAKAPVPNDTGAVEAESRHPLLERFPPDQGWGAERREAILLKTIVEGETPTGDERFFYMNYEAWKKALDTAVQE